METWLLKGTEEKNGETKLWNGIISGWLFLCWFQYDILMVSRNKEISCFTHKPIGVY